jgi:hypothetical protein
MHDVALSSLATNNLLAYDSTGVWKNKTFSSLGLATTSPTLLGGSEDLNTKTTPGLYHQNANVDAASGTNYPVALAGILTVHSGESFIYQQYQSYGVSGANKIYHRGYYSTAWSPWREVVTTDGATFTANIAVNNGTSTAITTTGATAAVFNANATTLNIGGAATTLNLGAATGNTQVNNNLVITGNLTVNGDQIITNTSTVEIEDSMIYVGTGNPANAKDIGLVGHFNNGTYQHTGIVRDATDGVWKIFSNISTEPSNDVLDFTAAVYDGLKIGSLSATSGAFSTTLSVTGATTLSSALTYGGVTLTNGVTGTAKMVLSESPTISGTLSAGIITATGTITATGAVAANGGITNSDATKPMSVAAGYTTAGGFSGTKVVMSATSAGQTEPTTRPGGGALQAGDIWIGW